MATSSRRTGMISLSFDMLEERSLLSHFSMPGFSDWGFPGGHAGAPVPAFSGSGAPDRSSGPFEGGPSIFSQARSSPVSAADFAGGASSCELDELKFDSSFEPDRAGRCSKSSGAGPRSRWSAL